jgi:hypothetical protein
LTCVTPRTKIKAQSFYAWRCRSWRDNPQRHPLSYALWYEHVAGINPSLSRVLEGRPQANEPLSEEDVHDLHARFIVARDVEALERLQHKR